METGFEQGDRGVMIDRIDIRCFCGGGCWVFGMLDVLGIGICRVMVWMQDFVTAQWYLPND